MKKIVIITAFLFLITLLFAGISSAVEVTLFGPKQFIRTKGKPNVYIDSFTIKGLMGKGKIIIKNGDENGKNRISSALIIFNDKIIFNPSDFNQQVYDLGAIVDLVENNDISVELRSKPESYIIIEIIKEFEAEAAGVIGPDGGIVEVDNPESQIYGLKVEVPEGALEEKVNIIVNESDELDGLTSELFIAGKCINFGPDGIQFGSPVYLFLPYNDKDDDGLVDGIQIPETEIGVLTFDPLISQWKEVNVLNHNTIDNLVQISTNHFSRFIPFVFLDQQKTIQLTTDPSDDFAPKWSPDGSKIAFLSRRDGISHLWVMNSDGSDQKRATAWAYEEGQFDWISNTELVFAAFLVPGKQHIFRVTIPEGDPVVVVNTPDVFNGNRKPRWSPIANKLAYVHQPGGLAKLKTINLDGTGMTDLDMNYHSEGQNWSHDGTKIAYTHYPGTPQTTIYTIMPDGTGKIALWTFWNKYPGNFCSWSPDDQYILMSLETREWTYGPILSSVIYRLKTDGSEAIPLTDETHINKLSLSFINRNDIWSPDGSNIVFQSDQDGDFDIYIMDKDGGNIQKLTDNIVIDEDASWSPDGSKIVYCSEVSGNKDIWILYVSPYIHPEPEKPSIIKADAVWYWPFDNFGDGASYNIDTKRLKDSGIQIIFLRWGDFKIEDNQVNYQFGNYNEGFIKNLVDFQNHASFSFQKEFVTKFEKDVNNLTYFILTNIKNSLRDFPQIAGIQLDMEGVDLVKYNTLVDAIVYLFGSNYLISITPQSNWINLLDYNYYLLTSKVDFVVPMLYDYAPGNTIWDYLKVTDGAWISQMVALLEAFQKPFYAGIPTYSYRKVYDINGFERIKWSEIKLENISKNSNFTLLDSYENTVFNNSNISNKDIVYLYQASADVDVNGNKTFDPNSIYIKEDEYVKLDILNKEAIWFYIDSARSVGQLNFKGICLYRYILTPDDTWGEGSLSP